MIIFFTSPIGLGHATRDLAICEELESLTQEKLQVGRRIIFSSTQDIPCTMCIGLKNLM